MPPGFCNRGVRYGSIGGLEHEVPHRGVRYGSIGGLEYKVPHRGVRYRSIGGLEYEVPQTAVQCICRVTRRSSMTMKAHAYYIIFGRPPWHQGEASPLPPSGGATDGGDDDDARRM